MYFINEVTIMNENNEPVIKKRQEKSSVALMLDISGYLVFIVGFLYGVFMFRESILMGLLCIAGGFAAASLIFGLSEIIYYLMEIKCGIKKLAKK